VLARQKKRKKNWGWGKCLRGVLFLSGGGELACQGKGAFAALLKMSLECEKKKEVKKFAGGKLLGSKKKGEPDQNDLKRH